MNKNEIIDSDIPVILIFIDSTSLETVKFASRIKDISEQYQDKVKVITIDFNSDSDRIMADQFSVRMYPSCLIYKQRVFFQQIYPAYSDKEVSSTINSAIAFRPSLFA